VITRRQQPEEAAEADEERVGGGTGERELEIEMRETIWGAEAGGVTV
jgi:hypothetical protein